MSIITLPKPTHEFTKLDSVEETATIFNKEYRKAFSCDGFKVEIEDFIDQYFQIGILCDNIDEPEGTHIFANLDDDNGVKITINSKHQKLFDSKPEFLKSSIGHELGHFVLGHLKKINKGANNLSLFTNESDEPKVKKPTLHRAYWKYNGLSSEELSALVKAAFQDEKARKILKMLDNKFEPDWMFYQAEHFSMCFLIAKDLLVERIEKENYSFTSWHPVYNLAKAFDVSVTMMSVRLQKLGFLILNENNKPANGTRFTEQKLF